MQTFHLSYEELKRSNTTTEGNIIDLLEANSLTFLLQSHSYTDGTFTMSVSEGDESDLSDAADIPADRLIGVAADEALSAANGQSAIGVQTSKRYVRLNVVSTGVTTGADISAMALKSSLRFAPESA